MKLRSLHTQPSISFFNPQVDSILELPYVSEGISAGFPSPADKLKNRFMNFVSKQQ